MNKYLVTCTFYISLDDMMSKKDMYEKQVFVECKPEDIIDESRVAVKNNNMFLSTDIFYHFIITNVFKL